MPPAIAPSPSGAPDAGPGRLVRGIPPIAGFAILAAWVVLVRAPSFDTTLMHSDEGFYLLQGDLWLRGFPPYIAVWDVKPPGLLALFAFFRLFGPWSTLAARLCTTLAVLISAAGLHRFARRHLLAPRAGIVAALLYPAFTIVLEGVTAQPELLLMPPIVFGMDMAAGWWTGRSRPPRAASCIAAGLLFGLAFLIKQSAVFELALAACVLAWATVGLPLLLFLAAAAAPSLLFIGYEALLGLGPGIYLTPFVGAVSRLSGYGETPLAALIRLPFMMRSAILLLAGALFALVERRHLARGPAARAIGLVQLWLAASLAAVLVAGSAYWHYFLAPLAPMALLTGLWIDLVANRFPRRRVAALIALVLVFAAYPQVMFAVADRPILRHSTLNHAIADRLRSLGFGPGDTLYVADQDPATYLLVGAAPPSRFAFPEHLLCNFPLPEGTAEDEIRRIMDGRPGFVVISEPRRKMVVCDWRTDRVASIDVVLARDYHRAALVDTGEETVAIYRRLDPARAAP
jgi:hypothetical protein